MGLLRIILAISVVVSHTSSFFGINFVGGSMAVELFFIISGFYMTMILAEKYVGNNSILVFYKSRLFRIFPLYFLILVLQFLVCLIALKTNPELESALTYFVNNKYELGVGALIFMAFENIILFGQEIIFFFSIDESGGLFFTTQFSQESRFLHHYMFIPQSWSVSLELLFYMIAPFIVTKKFRTVIIFMVFSICLSLTLVYNDLNHDPWNHRFLPVVIFYFLLGYLSYMFYIKIKKMKVSANYKLIKKRFALALLVLNILVLTFYYKLPVIVPNDIKYYAFLIFFTASLPFIFELTKNYAWDKYIGEMSYPIYLSHLLVVFVVSMFDINLAESGFFMVIFTILSSVLLYEVFLKPMENIRQNRIKVQLKSKD